MKRDAETGQSFRKGHAPFGYPHIPSPKEMKKRQSAFESEILRNLQSEEAARERLRKTFRAAYGPAIKAMNLKSANELAFKQIRAESERRRRTKLVPPKFVNIKPRTSLGSFCQTFTAPYDFGWAPSATTGNPNVQLEADQNSGFIMASLGSNEGGSSSGDAWAGVGVYWSIPGWLDQSSGTLQVTATCSESWTEFCAVDFDNARTTGWLVLNVDCFDNSGEFQGLVISNSSQLFDDGGSAQGETGNGSNSAFQISGQAQVDSDHFYNIWLFAHVNIYADGSHVFWGSWADGNVTATTSSLQVCFG